LRYQFMPSNFSSLYQCRSLLLFLLVLCGICAGASAHDQPVAEKLGTLSFPTSCSPAVQKDFERAVALLHSFAYSAAEAAFSNVADKDPNCAMAHWGIAMTYFHELWEPPLQKDSLERGREEIRRAKQSGGSLQQERGFIRALAQFYNEDSRSVPYTARVSKYESAMEELATTYRDDVESQVFYALALLASASPFDQTHAKQKHALKILEPLYRKHPEHPGIAHYLIHACDNREMARQGLAAAQAYSKIAPSAPHALHMPSHIFTRLGMWSESIASNRAARIAAHDQGDIGEELHAMDYLVYAELQEGREKDAREIIQQLNAMPKLDEGNFKVAYALTAMSVRYALERRQWEEAAAIIPPSGAPPHVVALAVWARALGLARSGHPVDARAQIVKLRQLELQLRESGGEYGEYWAKQVETQAIEASAWSDQADGKTAEARDLLRKAADQEDAMEKLPVTPGPIIPAREQLGDLLLEQRQPRLALKEFRMALSYAPKRRGALTGVSRASKALTVPFPNTPL
jgi:tetratricopeptide (TPR) repeat protein